MKKYVLDSCALIAFFNNEKGKEIVENRFEDALNADCEISMHRVNLFEVYYDIFRSEGEDSANELFEKIDNLPTMLMETLDNQLLTKAAFFKVNYKISFADSFALGLAMSENAALITADHHEFDIIEQHNSLKFEWIR